jgi:cytohesin
MTRIYHQSDSTPPHIYLTFSFRPTEQEGKLEVIKYLVAHGADVNAGGDYERTALHILSYQGHMDGIKWMVAEGGCQINAADCEGSTALHYAARMSDQCHGLRGAKFFTPQHHQDVVELLVLQGSDVLQHDKNDAGPSDVATDEEVARWLVSHESMCLAAMLGDDAGITAKIRSKMHAQETQLHFDEAKLEADGKGGGAGAKKRTSSKKKNKRIRKVCKEDAVSESPFYNGVQGGKGWLKWVHSPQAEAANSALMNAAIGNNIPGMVEALRAGASMTATNSHSSGWRPPFPPTGKTALHFAAELGFIAVVQWLVGLFPTGAMAADGRNTTALHYAAGAGHLAVVKWLVAKGANVNVVGERGRVVLHHAADKGEDGCREGYLQVMQWLVAQGADVNAHDTDGCNVLHRAAWNGSVPAVQWLVERGAYVNATDKAGTTALHRAADQGLGEVIVCLLALGANLEVRDQQGRTALLHCYNGAQTQSARKLSKYTIGAAVSCDDTMALLVKAGADVKAVDVRGSTIGDYITSANKKLHPTDAQTVSGDSFAVAAAASQSPPSSLSPTVAPREVADVVGEEGGQAHQAQEEKRRKVEERLEELGKFGERGVWRRRLLGAIERGDLEAVLSAIQEGASATSGEDDLNDMTLGSGGEWTVESV